MGAVALDGGFFGAEAADMDVVEGLADVEGYAGIGSGAEGGVAVTRRRLRQVRGGDIRVCVFGGGVEVESYTRRIASRVSWRISWGT